jgi:hypothetical protein
MTLKIADGGRRLGREIQNLPGPTGPSRFFLSPSLLLLLVVLSVTSGCLGSSKECANACQTGSKAMKSATLFSCECAP